MKISLKAGRILKVGLLACAIFAALPATAQRGEKTLGVSGGFATYNDGGNANIYFQYSFADHFRISPDIGYVFRNHGKSAFVCNVDMQFPFRIARGFAVYPLAGVTFNHWNITDYDNPSRIGFNLGAGMDFYITSEFKISLKGKYSMMNDTSGGFFDLGFGYVF